jgi:nucleotide-binding universal stress UspA family protein
VFKKVLVPLDGTADSERVLDWVKPFARLGAEIHLATIVDSRHLMEAHEFANLTDAVTEWADQYLAGILEEVRSEFPSTSSSRGTGAPAREILKIAEDVGADLIAMESHRGSAVVRGILGSCTDAIVRSGRLPVLVLPPGGASVLAPDKPATVLIPLDGSDLAENSLPIGTEIAAAFGADVHLLRSTTSALYAGDDFGIDVGQAWEMAIKSQEKDAGEYLDRQAALVRETVSIVTTQVSTDSGAGAITESLNDSPSTIAVMATHGRGGLRRMVLGSVTDKVIRSSHAPILVLPASGMPNAGETESDV